MGGHPPRSHSAKPLPLNRIERSCWAWKFASHRKVCPASESACHLLQSPSMTTKKTLITALMKTHHAAESAVKALVENGYARSDISVIMSDATRAQHFKMENGTKAAEGAGI